MFKIEIIILGDGGHSRVIQEIIFSVKSYNLYAVLDDKYQVEYRKEGIIYGPFSCLSNLLEQDRKIVIALGNNHLRKNVIDRLDLEEENYATIIHPTAVVSQTATIGRGTVIMPQAVVNAGAVIGTHCIVNTRAIVEHDTLLGDFTHLSPNATLTGNVKTGEGVHVGASATIIPGVEIGNWSTIGAGSTVIRIIPPYSKAVGSPSRIIEKKMAT